MLGEPPVTAGLSGLFNAGRQAGGALAVATFGALVSASFATGMPVSMLISAVLLSVSAVAAWSVFRRRVVNATSGRAQDRAGARLEEWRLRLAGGPVAGRG